MGGWLIFEWICVFGSIVVSVLCYIVVGPDGLCA